MTKKAFLLEDDEDVFPKLIKALEEAGYEVSHFEGIVQGGGRDLIESEFDLVILDLLQPYDAIGIGGVEALMILREKGANSLTFVITSYAGCIREVDTHEEGVGWIEETFPFVNGVIQKSYNVDWVPDLMEQIKAAE